MSFDPQEENKAFAEKFGYGFPLLCDTDKSIGIAYGAAGDASAGYPARITYVLDENGVITHALAKVDPKTHTDEMLGYVS